MGSNDSTEVCEFLYEIVENVRHVTDLSYKSSCDAVQVVIEHLKGVPNLNNALENYLRIFENRLRTNRAFECTLDGHRLQLLFDELKLCKDDSQQRSWSLHEDMDIISDYLIEILSILTKADAAISQEVLLSKNCLFVNSLVEFYQMETRWTIRKLLIEIFQKICTFDRSLIVLFLNSILPMELARDMENDRSNTIKLKLSAELLKSIFSTTEKMPVFHFDYFSEHFFQFIFDTIEHPPDRDEKVTDALLQLVLILNFQFDESACGRNSVVDALVDRREVQVWTQKMLLLINRTNNEDDDDQLLKLFLDVFSDSRASALFYTNDIKVLIDIIVAQLTNLPSTNQNRKLYLKLCQCIVQQPAYVEHNHRKKDIENCLQNLLDDCEIEPEEQLLAKVFHFNKELK